MQSASLPDPEQPRPPRGAQRAMQEWEVSLLGRDCREVVSQLFTEVFTASEGAQEGLLVGRLASALSALIDDQEVIAFGAQQAGSLLGCLFFTRLHFAQHQIRIDLLAPLAVSTAHQRQGIGLGLIHHGLQELRRRSLAAVLTYGDPAFYGQAGFRPLAQEVIQPPLQLSRPEGWLGRSLTAEGIPAIPERPTCVEPFRDPVYW
ncbi:GNAT family N-acetyltransferase [Synechococcus sp. CCY9202]|uniref:GNAT family N-acetyltransferase n=1 Tax=Synechococcus sp. CCY9202 TaxID=174698 RepID=UPI002B1F7CBE|nr:GNAT family N-acetyltransferase [Synechococcus sp. CCY9202]MEA5423679.1 GNAT family N-acetyltransferase [Synechococcus sp. CCY9202]